MAKEINMEGRESVPRWVLHAIESKLGDSEFALRQRSHAPATATSYFLLETSKQLAWARELIREHGKIQTEFWYDLPPYARKKKAKKPKKA